MSYNPAGKPLKMSYGNGIATDYAYDYANGYRLIAKQSKKGDRRYQIIGYTFDPIGNIIGLQEAGQPELQKTVTYGYDDLSHLIFANHVFNNGTGPLNENYAYDSIGNMTSGPAYQTATFGSNTVGTNPHALTQAAGISYVYDARGNLTAKTDSGTTSQYEYNIKNEMTAYIDANGRTEYEYDATGRRISKTNAGIATQYVNKLLEVELAHTSLQALSIPYVQVASDTGSGTATDSGATSSGATDSGATNTGTTSTGTGTVTDSGATSSGTTSSGTTDGSGTTSSGATTDSGSTSSGTTAPTVVTTPPKWSHFIFL